MTKKTPLNKINNGYAVFLILIPILGPLFFEPLIYSVTGISTIVGFLIYIGLNVTTIYYDELEMKKSNIKINNALIWAAILVPVYCYLRGSAINKIYNLGGFKSQWVFLCWLSTFFISVALFPQ